MDLVDYSEARFDEIRDAYVELARQLGLTRRALRAGVGAEGRQHRDARARACRGTRASRCSTCSKRLPVEAPTGQALRFPVQWVARQDGSQADDFRGYMGRVEAGEVRSATRSSCCRPTAKRPSPKSSRRWRAASRGGSRVRRPNGDDPSRGRRRRLARRHVRAARQRRPSRRRSSRPTCAGSTNAAVDAAQVPAEANHQHGVRAHRCDQGSARRAYAVAARPIATNWR